MRDQAIAARPTVLAVDDELAVRESLGLLLEDDYDLLLAGDGPSALELLRRYRVDVVLLDLFLPEMDGFDLLPRLLAVDPKLIVIVVTAATSHRYAVKAMKLGAWDYVTKPWDPDELANLVRQAAAARKCVAGVLLLSDDPVSLAPLHLALERHVPVAAAPLALVPSADVRANVVVFEPRAATADADTASVRERFPNASLVPVPDNPYRVDDVARVVLRLVGIPAAIHTLPTPVAKAIAFMSAHYHSHLLVADVARMAALSEHHLAHIFKDATGLPVQDYLTRLRVTIARRLLAETNAKIDVIAQRVGLGDGSSFSRTFVDVAGMRPGEFRRASQTV